MTIVVAKEEGVSIVREIRAAHEDDGDGDLETTHTEGAPLKFDLGESGKIETIAMNLQGELLVGITTDPTRRGQSSTTGHVLLTLRGDGAIKETWELGDLTPSSIFVDENGQTLVSGSGRLCEFDKSGTEVRTLLLSDVLNGTYATAHPSGLVADSGQIFLAFGVGNSTRATEDIVRVNRDFTNPVVILEKQFGCCSHIDLDLHDGELLIAENSRHRMNRFTRDGDLIARWGRRDRNSLEGFAACCNPVNFDFGSDGVLYTAESGVGRVKRYTAQGEFLGLVGMVDTTQYDKGSRLASQSCYIPVEVSPDGKRIYVMDVRANIVRVLVEKSQHAS